MVPDYHTHTILCKHATGTVADYHATARARGLTALAFTDHVPAPDGYDARCRMTLAEFPDYLELIRPLAVAGHPAVLVGVEADFYEGAESFLRDWLPRQPLDLVIGSVHYIRDWGFDNPDARDQWDRVDVTQAWRHYFDLVARLADTRLFDIVGHLDLPKKFGHRPPDAAVREMARPVLDRIARAGMAIEVNTSGLRKPVGEIYPSALLLGLAREAGVPICFGSDAHRPDEVGEGFAAALTLAHAAGYTHARRYQRRTATPYPLPLPG